MTDTFLLEVATPERLWVREYVREAQIPCRNGYIGVQLTYSGDKGSGSLRISGGWVEVLDDHVRVLADEAEENKAA
jgi:F-type H+-transporting ATPase subunit epsilon